MYRLEKITVEKQTLFAVVNTKTGEMHTAWSSLIAARQTMRDLNRRKIK